MPGFGQFGRMRQRTRRILSAVAVALFLGFQVFSAAYIIHEADHDCCGEGCPICVQIEQCVSNFQQTGTGIEADTTVVPIPVFAVEAAIPAEVQLPSMSLVSQKVQFNE